MNLRHPTLLLGLGNTLIVLLAITWAYTSTQYDWLNVGGKTGNITFWVTANAIVAYATFAAWLLVIPLTIVIGLKFKANGWRLTGATLTTVFLGPAAMFIASWLFHLGFPPPPPM